MPLQIGPEIRGHATFKGFSEGPLVQYQVIGLPPGEQAFLVLTGKRWGFLRFRGDERPELAGDYVTSDDALAGLQAEIER